MLDRAAVAWGLFFLGCFSQLFEPGERQTERCVSEAATTAEVPPHTLEAAVRGAAPEHRKHSHPSQARGIVFSYRHVLKAFFQDRFGCAFKSSAFGPAEVVGVVIL